MKNFKEKIKENKNRCLLCGDFALKDQFLCRNCLLKINHDSKVA